MQIASFSWSHHARAVLALVLQGILAILGVVLLFVAPAQLPSTYVLSVSLALLLTWSLASWRFAGLRLFDYWVLVMSAFLLNAGHALREVINSNEAGLMNGIFSEVIN